MSNRTSVVIFFLFIINLFLGFFTFKTRFYLKSLEVENLALKDDITNLEDSIIANDKGLHEISDSFNTKLAGLENTVNSIKNNKIVVKQEYITILLALNNIERKATRNEDISRNILAIRSVSKFDPNIESKLNKLQDISIIKNKTALLKELRGVVSEIQYLKYKKGDGFLSFVKKFLYKYIVFIKKDSNLYNLEEAIKSGDYAVAVQILEEYKDLPSDKAKNFTKDIRDRILFYETIDDVSLYISYVVNPSIAV